MVEVEITIAVILAAQQPEVVVVEVTLLLEGRHLQDRQHRQPGQRRPVVVVLRLQEDPQPGKHLLEVAEIVLNGRVIEEMLQQSLGRRQRGEQQQQPPGLQNDPTMEVATIMLLHEELRLGPPQ